MTRLYIVRHGSTAWNEIVRFRGSADIALSEKGREQAEALSQLFREVPLSAIFSSPQRRAMETVSIINRYHSLPIQEREELKSVNYGDWEGRLLEEVARDYPQLYREYIEHIESFRFPQGETLDDLRKRALSVVEEALLSFPGGQILVVTHQVVSRVLICALIGIDNSFYWRIGQDPGCVNAFDFQEGEFILRLLNFPPGIPSKI